MAKIVKPAALTGFVLLLVLLTSTSEFHSTEQLSTSEFYSETSTSASGLSAGQPDAMLASDKASGRSPTIPDAQRTGD